MVQMRKNGGFRKGGETTFADKVILFPFLFSSISLSLLCNPSAVCHIQVFANEMNHAIQTTAGHYEATLFKEALKSGFFEYQVRIFIFLTY